MRNDIHIREIDYLASKMRDRSLTDEDKVRLEELIKHDPECRRRFAEHMFLESELKNNSEIIARAVPHAPIAVFIRKIIPHGIAAILTIAFTLAGVFLFNQNQEKQPTQSVGPIALSATEESNAVAVIKQTMRAKWGEETTASKKRIKKKLGLQPSRLHLESGVAQIDFYNGATAIIEGPAMIDLVNPDLARLHFGKLRANVPPPAIGFQIETTDYKIVDLGTEFAVDLKKDGTSEVHVIEGEIEVHQDSHLEDPTLLTTGEALDIDQTGHNSPKPSAPNKFAGTRYFRDSYREKHSTWLNHQKELRAQKDTVALYNFQGEHWQQELENLAFDPGSNSNGNIVGCQWVRGRWPGKKGLAYKNPSHRVRTFLPESYDNLTLSTWVRIDSMPNKRTTLMFSEGNQDFAIFWEIFRSDKSNKAKILFADTSAKLKESETNGENPQIHVINDMERIRYYTPAELNVADLIGSWCHFAVTYSRETQKVTHYVNGEPFGEIPLIRDRPIGFGTADIGNWPYRDWAAESEFAVRNLNGRMDEMYIARRALSKEEIAELYEIGKP